MIKLPAMYNASPFKSFKEWTGKRMKNLQGLLDKTEPEQIQRGIMMKVSGSACTVCLSLIVHPK